MGLYDDVIIILFFNFHFEFETLGMERWKIQKSEYRVNIRNFSDSISSTFTILQELSVS